MTYCWYMSCEAEWKGYLRQMMNAYARNSFSAQLVVSEFSAEPF